MPEKSDEGELRNTQGTERKHDPVFMAATA